MSRSVYARKCAEWPDKKSSVSKKLTDTPKKAVVMINREQKLKDGGKNL